MQYVYGDDAMCMLMRMCCVSRTCVGALHNPGGTHKCVLDTYDAHAHKLVGQAGTAAYSNVKLVSAITLPWCRYLETKGSTVDVTGRVGAIEKVVENMGQVNISGEKAASVTNAPADQDADTPVVPDESVSDQID